MERHGVLYKGSSAQTHAHMHARFQDDNVLVIGTRVLQHLLVLKRHALAWPHLWAQLRKPSPLQRIHASFRLHDNNENKRG